MNSKTACELVDSIIAFQGNLPALIAEFRTHLRNRCFDDSAASILSITHIEHVLSRFITGDVSAKEVEEWAEFLEGNEWITYEARFHDTVTTLLFYLSSPDINGELTTEMAKEMMRQFAADD